MHKKWIQASDIRKKLWIERKLLHFITLLPCYTATVIVLCFFYTLKAFSQNCFQINFLMKLVTKLTSNSAKWKWKWKIVIWACFILVETHVLKIYYLAWKPVKQLSALSHFFNSFHRFMACLSFLYFFKLRTKKKNIWRGWVVKGKNSWNMM